MSQDDLNEVDSGHNENYPNDAVTQLVEKVAALLSGLRTETLSGETRELIQEVRSLLSAWDSKGEAEKVLSSHLKFWASQIDLDTYLWSFYNANLDDEFSAEDLHEVVVASSWDIMTDIEERQVSSERNN